MSIRRVLGPTEQEKLFSQSDLHHVQRGGGVDTADSATPRIGANGNQYSGPRVTPAGWYERDLVSTAVTIIGGNSLLLDDDCGFTARTAMCDNYSNQWLKIDGVRRTIAPYSVGWVLAIPSGSQSARVRIQAPSANVPQPAALANENIWVGFSESFLPPSNGILIPNSSAVLGQNVDIQQVGGVNLGPGPALPVESSASSTDIELSSANAAAANNLIIPGAAGVFTYISGFSVTGTGATAGSTIAITITGLTQTLTYWIVIPAGAAIAITPLIVEFVRPIPSSAVNTGITLNVPSFGAGNLNAAATLHGFRQ